ncbi:kinesin motor domain-containing protein [Hirsutella rhossiliensis]|uniref:Kinesin motor domain-containing protein n=1 Tax=Hirsutella rhossiliensis TaxID=111463 RepID=A0A9P8N3C3_9HYPO|nr:kinesin motor domain-containing protein [Hirsutella rhossiliensis]KAH0966167.1 kinesin motor domain-containing protein [Hirsutella rhossiliensis]
MAHSPPASPIHLPQRPLSAIARPPPRCPSRMSISSKPGSGSRASDDDSRTAVKVAVRIRPPLNPSDPGYDLIPQRFQRSMVQTMSNTSLSIESPQGRKLFVFDRVFSPDVMQNGIWDYLADSVSAFTQGYNVSLLAYGQSGAGKSYTMGTSGPSEQQDAEMMGVIPRAAAALFDKLNMSRSGTNPNRASATYVEIYNEQLRDLLVPDTSVAYERGNVAIREDAKGNIILTGLHQVDIDSVDDLMNALNFGSTIRQTDATAINAKSSRSHAVFSLNLVQRRSQLHTSNSAEKRFSLHFVDLAGSERLKNTGAQGERAKEGISINAGLASLGKDSLGGNAITYMIACVTPAEFHLSETLNTVQYAQRARAIQSKPRIQQVEEGDKQAVIDRLRAEVSFLREQIRSASVGGGSSPRRVSGATNDRSDRQNEREVELQNQLLDVQENYNALSQRHAMLITEMAKAREHESEETGGKSGDFHGDSATDRLNRSNYFAQAVEQVVLEYEKTIQSLEQSLSNTRATLSNTETSLLEKETKCAYVETINNQLQSRLQKLMDREASTENYLHDLEAKLDGHTSGEEKNATIIMELRKEIARVRESEASCEDYISTLEERLAEADQDAELMQREIDRLEQVIERQRSLGKLDALLHELDHVDGAGKPKLGSTDGFSLATRQVDPPLQDQSHGSHQGQVGSPIPEDDERGGDGAEAKSSLTIGEATDGDSLANDRAAPGGQVDGDDAAQSPAQSRLVADKLESVTQELIGLRVEHETTMNDLHELHAKYEEAMRSLADLQQDAADEARHPPRVRDSVLSAGSEAGPDGPRSSASRSLSSELSSAVESSASADTDATSEDDTATAKPAVSTEDLTQQPQDDALKAELQRLRSLAGEKEAAEKELATKYAQLESQHNETLDMVEELKTEVSKARAVEATSPRQSTPVIRRKSSQNVMIIDRAHRSFASLRNIATENFEGQPEVMQNFELNLNAAIHELHSRSERIQELEANVASAKKEMETKMTIISGLTQKLEKNEMQLHEMREAHAAREKELAAELEKLRGSLEEASTSKKRDKASARADEESGLKYEGKIGKLQSELTGWENKHRTILNLMQATEMELRHTVQQLEAQVVTLNANLVDSQARASVDGSEAAKEAEQKHRNLVNFLRTEIDEYKAVMSSNATKVTELESSHATARGEVEEMTKAHSEAAKEASRYRELVAELEAKVASHGEATRAHHEALEQLKSGHAKELAELQSREQKGYEEQVEVLMSEHAESVHKLESELSGAREELMQIATKVAVALGLGVSVDTLTDQIELLVAAHKADADEQRKAGEVQERVARLTHANESTVRDLETAKTVLSDMLAEEDSGAASSIADQLSAVKGRMSDLEFKNKKNSRLVEELEEQLQNNFDEVQITNNRLSTLQTERNVQLEEVTAARAKLQAELDSVRDEYNSLQAKYHEAIGSGDVNRSNSNSTIRKSASHAALPSPPPAIPLPPLPSAARSGSPTSGVPTSPTSGRTPSKEGISIAQITEDQEARIRTIEKHLYAERQLTQTLEEALTDLERQSKRSKADCDAWKKRAHELEGEVKELKERPMEAPQDNRWSLHAVEEERKKRQAAEAARKQLEERMNAINKGKKKKGSLNCF